MSWSKLQRLMLINQYRILARLEDTADYDEFIEILESGQTHRYSVLTEHLSEDLSPVDERLVMDILDIYRGIDAYAIGKPQDDPVLRHSMFRFKGFDGNHETELMGLVRFHIKNGRWQEVQKHAASSDDFNSHTSMRDRYESMIRVRQAFGQGIDFSQDQALKILDAGR